MTGPENAPFVSVKLERRGWTGAWVEVQGFQSARIQSSLNAASSMSVQFQSPRGSRVDEFSVGQWVRLSLGLGGVPNRPKFYGFAANPAHLFQPSVSSSGFECYDFLAQAAREKNVRLTETGINYDGWDASMAIRDLFEGLQGTPVDALGCSGTYPKVVITPEMGVYYPNFVDRLTLAQRLNDSCWDDLYPDLPLPYRLWQDGEGRVHHRKMQPLSTSYPRATIQYEGTLHSLDVRVRSSKLATGASVTGAKDPESASGDTYWSSYSEASQIAVKGLWHRSIARPDLASSDQCQAWAKRMVSLYRTLYIAKEVVAHEPLHIWPGDVIRLQDPVNGRAENLRVTQIDTEVSPGKFEQRLMLGNFTYMPTEYI